MNNNNLIILAVLGIGGYLAYTQFKKKEGSSIPGYTPTPSGGGRFRWEETTVIR
jgi:hypothetical protein